MRTGSRDFPLRRAAAPLLTALVLTACGAAGEADSPPEASPGSTLAAALAAPATLDGSTVDAEALANGDTVLWFWAPWCVLCRSEAPDVIEVAERYDINVVGVAGRGELADIEDFVDETSTGSLTHLADVNGDIWDELRVFGQPAFAFIDDTGDVEVFVGSLGERALEERVAELINT